MNLQLGSHDLPCRLLQVSVGRQGENAGRGPLSLLSSAASVQIVLKAYVCFCICVNRKHQILTDLVFSRGGNSKWSFPLPLREGNGAAY